MPRGTLEVFLVSAKGLDNDDFLTDIDPYVILTLQTQEHKSNVIAGAGSNPEWNESFLFTIPGDVSELRLKIMDKDNCNSDDFLGEAIIPLEPVICEGTVPNTPYNVVKDEEYRGEIRVSLSFTPEFPSEGRAPEEESYGGWKESSDY